MKIYLHLIAIALLCASCGNRQEKTVSINYPSPQPDTTALRFLPGLVTSDTLDFNAAFSTDGQHFYFSRSYHGRYVIMESRNQNGQWTEPVISSLFDTSVSNTDPFVAENNDLYFISKRPRHAQDTIPDYDIYRMQWKDSAYGKAEALDAINSDSTEYYVSVARNGNIYFSSYREGNLDLYFGEKKESGYLKPLNLGRVINTDSVEHDPLIAPDERFLIFASVRPEGAGEADLYIAFKADTGWQAPKNMGPRINTARYEYCPNLSPDGKYFFFSSEFDVKWISASVLEKYR